MQRNTRCPDQRTLFSPHANALSALVGLRSACMASKEYERSSLPSFWAAEHDLKIGPVFPNGTASNEETQTC